MKSLNFVSIDFETANERPDSACSLGIVRVVGGKITDRRYRLIRPPGMRFSAHNIRVHGILPKDVAGEPEFSRYWKAISALLGKGPVIAHNAEFDFAVLRAVLAHYQLPFPTIEYSCSLRIARRVWKGMRTYSLGPLAAQFGYRFAHHHALEDAEAAAWLMIQAAKSEQADNLQELNTKAGIECGFLRSDGSYRTVKSLPRKKKK